MKKLPSNEKELPKIYKSIVATEKNKKYFYSKNEINNVLTKKTQTNKTNNSNIKEKVSHILKPNMLYSNEVTIILKNNKIRTRIIRKYDNYILTIDNDKIDYSEIIDILE